MSSMLRAIRVAAAIIAAAIAAAPPAGADPLADLMKILPAGYGSNSCKPAESKAALAAVNCRDNSLPGGPTYATYSLFGDYNGMHDAFTAQLKSPTWTPTTSPECNRLTRLRWWDRRVSSTALSHADAGPAPTGKSEMGPWRGREMPTTSLVWHTSGIRASPTRSPSSIGLEPSRSRAIAQPQVASTAPGAVTPKSIIQIVASKTPTIRRSATSMSMARIKGARRDDRLPSTGH